MALPPLHGGGKKPDVAVIWKRARREIELKQRPLVIAVDIIKVKTERKVSFA